jgi:hypothetical protein
MQTTKAEIYGITLLITGILLAFMLCPEDTKASILAGIDEPTGNAYDDLYFAEEGNSTITSGLNQTANKNNTEVQK